MWLATIMHQNPEIPNEICGVTLDGHIENHLRGLIDDLRQYYQLAGAKALNDVAGDELLRFFPALADNKKRMASSNAQQFGCPVCNELAGCHSHSWRQCLVLCHRYPEDA